MLPLKSNGAHCKELCSRKSTINVHQFNSIPFLRRSEFEDQAATRLPADARHVGNGTVGTGRGNQHGRAGLAAQDLHRWPAELPERGPGKWSECSGSVFPSQLSYCIRHWGSEREGFYCSPFFVGVSAFRVKQNESVLAKLFAAGFCSFVGGVFRYHFRYETASVGRCLVLLKTNKGSTKNYKAAFSILGSITNAN